MGKQLEQLLLAPLGLNATEHLIQLDATVQTRQPGMDAEHAVHRLALMK